LKTSGPVANATSAVIGHGRLNDAITAILGSVTTPSDGNCTLVVLATDTWSRHAQDNADLQAKVRSLPWLRIFSEPGRVVVGPLVRPDVPGCAGCADARRLTAMADPESYREMAERYQDKAPWPIAALAVDIITALVREEAERLWTGREPRLSERMLLFDLASFAVSVHRFLPDPHCLRCGLRPVDSRMRAVIRFDRRPKRSRTSLRQHDLRERRHELNDLYVDPFCGILLDVTRDLSAIFCTSRAALALPAARRVEFGFGQAADYVNSDVVALVEALERYSGLVPRRTKTSVRGSFSELRQDAIDPTTLGMPDPGLYAAAGERLDPLTDDRVMNWVWAYSFARRQPVLVPEWSAYYGLRWFGSREPHFAYEISNGCAAGSCIEEAVLHGLLEACERDAFLLTWYAQLPLRRLDLESAPASCRLLAGHLQQATHYSLHAFDMTMEHGVPAVWMMAINDLPGQDRPHAVCAAAAHLRPEGALESAIREVSASLAWLTRAWRREAALPLLSDPLRVREVHDHALLYGLQEAFPRFDFLFRSNRTHRLDEMAAWTLTDDVADDVNAVLARFLETGLDVIVVRQTSPEQRRGGLECVKVLVPGLLPMTFGHFARRVLGLPRLVSVPYQLGYRDGPLSLDDVNPHPHPFP